MSEKSSRENSEGAPIIENTPLHPFAEQPHRMENETEHFESDIYELEKSGHIVKEIKIQEGISFEDTLERLKKSVNLLKKYGFKDFLPETNIVVGHGVANPGRTIYLVQEKIEGDFLWKTSNISEANFSQLDELLKRSYELWEETRKLSLEKKKELPMGIGIGQKIRTADKDEGLLPDISNSENIMIGKTKEDKEPRVYLIDVGLVMPTSYELFYYSRPEKILFREDYAECMSHLPKSMDKYSKMSAKN